MLPAKHDHIRHRRSRRRKALEPLELLVGEAVTLLPQNVFVEIAGAVQKPLRHSGAQQRASEYHVAVRREKIPQADEDTLSVVPGFSARIRMPFSSSNEYDVDRFVDMLASMQTEGDYARLLDNYGVRRTNPNFWRQSDAFHAAYRTDAPVEYGLFDYNRLENR